MRIMFYVQSVKAVNDITITACLRVIAQLSHLSATACVVAVTDDVHHGKSMQQCYPSSSCASLAADCVPGAH